MKEAATSFLKLVASGRTVEGFQRYVGPGFKHHNPYFKGDPETLRSAMQENADQFPGKVFEVQRALEDGDLVAVHSKIQFGPASPAIAVVHICRFAGGKIVELWDIAQQVPESSPNEHGMF